MSVPQLTQREWELVREMTSMIDIDVLSDNLERGGNPVSSDEELCELLGKVLAHVPYAHPTAGPAGLRSAVLRTKSKTPCDAAHDGHDCTVPGACQLALIALCERVAARRERGERHASSGGNGENHTLKP